MNKDLEHLRLLSIFHYVVAALIALFACFPLIYVAMGVMFMLMPIPPEAARNANQQNPEVVFRTMGAVFAVLGTIFALLGWTLAVCTILAGRNLARHQKYTFCLVVAGIICIFMPFGTILGVFTLVVLLREPVKAIFDRNAVSFGNQPASWK